MTNPNPNPETRPLAEDDLLSGPFAELFATMPAPVDPLWLSALRGRVLAAIASGASLAASGCLLYQQVGVLAHTGVTADAAVQIANQAANMTDAAFALVVSAASLIGLLASINSKAREWLAARFP